MKLFRTQRGCLVEEWRRFYLLTEVACGSVAWDALVTRDDLYQYLLGIIQSALPVDELSGR